MIRAVLDTSAIADQIDGTGAQFDWTLLEAAVQRADLAVSLADSAYCEIVVGLVSKRAPWHRWLHVRRSLARILDTELPVLPGGRELTLYAGLTGARILAQDTRSFQRRAWKVLLRSDNAGKFRRALREVRNGRRESLDDMYVRIEHVVDSARQQWIHAIGRIRDVLVRDGVVPADQEEIAGAVLLALEEPKNDIAVPTALTTMARALGRFAALSVQGKTPYNPKGRSGEVTCSTFRYCKR